MEIDDLKLVLLFIHIHSIDFYIPWVYSLSVDKDTYVSAEDEDGVVHTKVHKSLHIMTCPQNLNTRDRHLFLFLSFSYWHGFFFLSVHKLDRRMVYDRFRMAPKDPYSWP
jgi:hypothetical protein